MSTDIRGSVAQGFPTNPFHRAGEWSVLWSRLESACGVSLDNECEKVLSYRSQERHRRVFCKGGISLLLGRDDLISTIPQYTATQYVMNLVERQSALCLSDKMLRKSPVSPHPTQIHKSACLGP